MPRVAVNVVTYNSSRQIDACLEGVYRQDAADFAVTVVDNGSRDDTLARLAGWQGRGIRVIANPRNLYYSRAHNLAIRRTDSEFVLTLNPDVIMAPDFLSRALEAFAAWSRIGSVNGKLLLAPAAEFGRDLLAGTERADALIDSAGLMMYRSRRPYLRGYRKPSRAHCLYPAYIFGADGACAMYRRAMLEDAAIDGEYFDEDFVIYREDVDLAWRAQLFGWESYYVPSARGYHVRGFHLGQKRAPMAAALKRHSVKNGWLLLLKNERPAALLRDLPWIVPYQLKIAAGLLAIERSSLGAIGDTLRLLPRMRRKHAAIQARRVRSDAAMRRWFE